MLMILFCYLVMKKIYSSLFPSKIVLTESRPKNVYVSNIVELKMNFMLLCNAHCMYDDERSNCLNSIHVLSHELKELTSEHQFIEIVSNPL